MTAHAPDPQPPEGRCPATGRGDGPSATMRLLAGLILLASAGGLAVHVALYVLGSDEILLAFIRGAGARVSAGLALATLLASHVHYWRTRMRLDIASRVLAYLWILSIVLFLHRVMGGFSFFR